MFLTSSPSLSLHLSFRVSENRIRIALQAVHPDYHRMRLNGASRSLNPQPYQAAYFGEKLHIDQNEKLVMFGVICQHASEKPCTDISTLVQVNSCTNWKLYISYFSTTKPYRPILVEYGLFDQIRVDHHKEWTLYLFVQESLAHLRHSVQKPPHRQTLSTLVIYHALVHYCIIHTGRL